MAADNHVPLLKLDGVNAGYLDTVILEEVDFDVHPSESMAVLGRNGVGKSTLLRTIMGQTKLYRGTLGFDGTDLTNATPWDRAHRGIGYVPQEREVFVSLTVEENLQVAAVSRHAAAEAWTTDRVYELFPRLKERRKNFGNQLSGGEQQMLAIGRALMSNPLLLLMDEPFEGLAPVVIDSLILAIGRLREEENMAIVLVEQHAQVALEMTDRVCVLDRGQVVHNGISAELLHCMERLPELMGISGSRVGV